MKAAPFTALQTLGCLGVLLAASSCDPRAHAGDAEPKPAHEPAGEAKPNVAPAPTTAPTTTPTPTPTTTTPAVTAPLLVKRTHELMGTVVQMTVVGVPEEQAAPVIEQAFAEMRRLEQALSEWIPDSEISRVNDAAGEHPVPVGDDVLTNVRVALEVAKWSDGAFDISWAALHDLYRFRQGDERVPTKAQLKERLPLVDYRKIIIDEKAKTVFLKKKGMRLGLGGIAKGYALDRVAEIFARAGFANYMVFGGGQVLVHGKKGDRGWRVGIQHPRMDDYFAFVESTSGSISTSGDYEHAFMRDGKRWHHIIDLKTGMPALHTTSVTVLCESALYGDAVDTALFIMGAKKAMAKLASAPGPGLEAVIVDKDLGVHVSPGMKDKLIWRMPLTNGRLPLP